MPEEQDLITRLDLIVWGRRIVELEDGRTFVFKPLSIEERNIANYVYDQTTKIAYKKNMMDREALTKQAINQGLWKSSYTNDIEVMREELKTRSKELEDEEEINKRRQTPNAKSIGLKRRISYIIKHIQKLENDHANYIDLPSIEYHAERERGTYSLHCSTFTFPDMIQAWPTFDSLKNETDIELVAYLTSQYYNLQIADEAQVRELARSALWRVKWIASKKNRGVLTLFGREMFDLTVDQFRLVYWSQIYDSAFESMDPPSDEIIDDDKLFDQWLDEQATKRKSDRNSSAINKRIGSHKGKDGQEIAVDVNGYYCNKCTCGVINMNKSLRHLHAPTCPYGVYIYYNDEVKAKKIEEVQSSNSKGVRQLLAAEQQKMTDSGDFIDEQDLRKDPRTRATLGMPTRTVGPDDHGKQGRLRRRR